MADHDLAVLVKVSMPSVLQLGAVEDARKDLGQLDWGAI